jgi:uncharacterized protein (TIGR00369 family)
MEFTEEFIRYTNNNPLYATLGVRIEKAVNGKARSSSDSNPNVCWPFPGQPHGGILFTVMDATMAVAVFSSLEGGQNCATIHADIQYTLPAKGDHFTCVARITHETGRLTFVRCEIHDMENQIVASGQAAFRFNTSLPFLWLSFPCASGRSDLHCSKSRPRSWRLAVVSWLWEDII